MAGRPQDLAFSMEMSSSQPSGIDVNALLKEVKEAGEGID